MVEIKLNSNLPEDVVKEILLRLPVESLMRFKCVSMAWNDLFQSPDFVSMHMKYQPPKEQIIVKHRSKLHNRSMFSFLSNVDDGDYSVSEVIDMRSELSLPTYLDTDDALLNLLGDGLLNLFGQCDGIVALTYGKEEILLCNPGIRDQIRILPKSSFHPFPWPPKIYDPDYSVESVYSEINGIGIGYDTKSKDYKIVRIVGFWTDWPNKKLKEGVIPLRAEVFLVGKDSHWREINDCEIGGRIKEFTDEHTEQYFDGVYYWCAETLVGNKLLVLSFDMANEVFQTVPMPNCCYVDTRKYEYKRVRLGVFNNESIALFVSPITVFPVGKYKHVIEVWVMMKELGGFAKILNIGPLTDLARPLTFWKNDKEYLQEDVEAQLVSFNVANPKKINKINILESINISGPRQCVAFQTRFYKKTLVSVHPKKRLADHVDA